MQSKNFKAIGSRLKEVRKNAGMTQAQFADAVKTNHTYLSRVESGKQRPSHDLIESVSKRFGVTIGWLYAAEDTQVSGVEAPDQLGKILPEKSTVAVRESLAKRARTSRSLGKLLLKIDREGRSKEGFGYVGLIGIKIRLAAMADERLKDSHLLEIATDDNLWFAAGDPTGIEFEVLRAYYDAAGDRDVDHWMEALRVLRWFRECLALAIIDESDEGLSSAQSA